MIDEPLKEQGRPEGERNNVDAVKFNSTQGGNSHSYILRRLARDGAEDASKAELFKQVTKGNIHTATRNQEKIGGKFTTD